MKSRLGQVVIVLVLAATILAACGPVDSGATEKTIYVGPELVDCVGVAPQKCMQVKENPGDPWTLFYDQIDGFGYEEGYEYELQIREEEVVDPPADASSIKWSLVQVISKTEVPVSSSDAALEGVTWTLVSYVDSTGQTVKLLPDSEITAQFATGEVRGNAGCNSYFGSYQIQGNSLSVGPLGMTEMYCMPDELMTQETDYLAALASAVSFEAVDGQLQISNESSEPVLTFAPLEPPEPMPLTGTLWQLTGYNNGTGGFSSVLADTEITATFDQDGKLLGSGGCNGYSATYEVDGDQITVDQIASTLMPCGSPKGIMEQDSDHLNALASASTFGIQGQELTIWNAEGQKALTYTEREPKPLVDTEWQLISYNNGREAIVSVLAGTEITAILGPDGNLSGSAGCNNYAAAYQVDGSAISIGPAATTRKMCSVPEGIMQQESDYVAALEMVTNYQIEGDRLLLMGEDGRRLADYVIVAKSTGLDEKALMNMEYKSEWTESGTAPLVDGEYSEQAAPGSATMTTVTLLPEHTATGQLNGQDAAAVVLVTNPGGSGTFFDLAVVANVDGQPVNIATTSLGDRAQINSVTIEVNQIVVDMITHGPEDPMCCPTQRVVKSYALQGDQLVETGSRTIDSGTGSGPGLVGTVWQWETFLEANDNTILVPKPEQYTIEFLANGQIQMQADCNSVGGSYTVEGSALGIELGPTTLAACPPGSLADEYLGLLQDVNSYMMDGDNLALAVKYDTGILKFAPSQ